MNRFKVGDRVKVVNATANYGYENGDIGVVVDLDYPGGVHVSINGHTNKYMFNHEIEHADKEHRYPWKSAPKWAMYAATDGDGSRYWYEKVPEAQDGDFWSYCGRYAPIDDETQDWEDSLEMRPDEFKPKSSTKEMTVAEIEKALGYPVKIVKE